MNQPTIESVAKALVLNQMNEVLVLTIGQHKTKPEMSFQPDLPGGLVDPGETEHDAVVREINEETGVVIDKTELTMVYSKTEFIDQENKSVTKYLFIARLDHKPDIELSWEHSEYQWIPLENLKAVQLRLFYNEAIKYCFSTGVLNAKA